LKLELLQAQPILYCNWLSDHTYLELSIRCPPSCGAIDGKNQNRC